MREPRIPASLRAVMENGVPVLLATCSSSGEPNASVASQAYYVDDHHVAVSFQFFNKTNRNVRENPNACLALTDLTDGRIWILGLAFERSETEGPLFDAMDLQIEAIASETGMTGIFKLRAADVYRIRSIARLPDGTEAPP